MESTSSFLNALTQVEQKIARMNAETGIIRQLVSVGNMDEAYAVALRLEKYSERNTLLTRILPVYTYKPTAYVDVAETIRKAVPVEIGFTSQGWFRVKIPALLPKKEYNPRSYIRSYLYPALQDFFSGKEPVRYDDAVLIFQHIYDQSRPERRCRDHDNIEVNTVADTIALFVLTDDGPSICSHYACSAMGDADFTLVYVVPRKDFPRWLQDVQDTAKIDEKLA